MPEIIRVAAGQSPDKVAYPDVLAFHALRMCLEDRLLPRLQTRESGYHSTRRRGPAADGGNESEAERRRRKQHSDPNQGKAVQSALLANPRRLDSYVTTPPSTDDNSVIRVCKPGEMRDMSKRVRRRT